MRGRALRGVWQSFLARRDRRDSVRLVTAPKSTDPWGQGRSRVWSRGDPGGQGRSRVWSRRQSQSVAHSGPVVAFFSGVMPAKLDVQSSPGSLRIFSRLILHTRSVQKLGRSPGAAFGVCVAGGCRTDPLGSAAVCSTLRLRETEHSAAQVGTETCLCG